MLRLAIDHRAAGTISAHPSRGALAGLLKFLDATGYDYRATQATWIHSLYKIFDRPHGVVGDDPASGHARHRGNLRL